jgi:hypothetical protein
MISSNRSTWWESPSLFSHLTDLGEAEAQPERAAGSADRLTGAQIHVMSTIQSAPTVVAAADQARQRREQLEIPCSKRSRLIREGERLVGIQPCSPT